MSDRSHASAQPFPRDSAQSRWRNRSEFVVGREQIVGLAQRKGARELGYPLIKELWAFQDNRIAVRFA
jgi:nuclear transport factor 2 (NTF2) superfamily protein